MTPEQIVERLKARHQDAILAADPSPKHPFVKVAPAAWREVAETLRDELGMNYLVCLTAIDRGAELEAFYNLEHLADQRYGIGVRVLVPRDNPVIPTVEGVWRTADWHEREAWDLMGIKFEGHHNLVRILCAEDWEGHPLRKDYKSPDYYHGVKNNIVIDHMPDPAISPVQASDVRSEEMLLNMGPQHPSTHGVFRVVVRSDGEVVLDCEPHVGYLHRCFEKHCESVTVLQSVLYTDRLDYLMSMGNNLGYSIAFERLWGDTLVIPERAQYIRIIVTELNRIASHLMAIGTYGMDIGAVTPFLYCFRDREKILYILETICGQRLNYNYVRPGGVAYDIDDKMVQMVKDFCGYFRPRAQEYNDLLSDNEIFVARTANIGVLPVDVAIQYGCTGPVLRGSGMKRDLRKDAPYCIYDRFEFDVPVGTGERGTLGDCYDRYMVRVREMLESLKIVEQAVKAIPDGPVKADAVKTRIRPPKGEAFTRVENSRGELGFYVICDGKEIAQRVKCRAPSFHNISVLPEISRGGMIADMVAIIGSMDIVMGEVDR